MSSKTAVPPSISWAQRNDLIFVIINVECKDVDYKFTEDTMNFKGTSLVGNILHEVTLNFYNKINPDKITTKNISRCLEFTIYKQNSGPYWPTLTNDKKKPHFLKVDFNKWVDENDGSDNEGMDNVDLMQDLMNMRGDGDGKPSFDDFDDDQEDSDDENIPQLSSDKDEEDKEAEDKNSDKQ